MKSIRNIPNKSFIKKVLADDSKNGVISPEPVTLIKKRSKYWMLTIYRDNIDDEDGEFAVDRCIEHIKSNFKNINYIVGQMETGETSKELHIHIAVTFNSSTCYPVETFNRLFPGVYISCDKNCIYYDYCSKMDTKVDNTTIMCNFFGIEVVIYSEKHIAKLEEDIANLRAMCQLNATLIERVMKIGHALINSPNVDKEEEEK